jgi:hypothetical protein
VVDLLLLPSLILVLIIITLSGEVDMNLDLRHPSHEGLQALENECREILRRLRGKVESNWTLTIWVSPAVKFDMIAVGFVMEAGYETALTNGVGDDQIIGIRFWES